MNYELIFFHSRICPRCLRVRRLLGKIQEEYPEFKVKKVGSVTKFIKRDLYTLPAVQIGDTVLYGKEVTESRVLSELHLS